MRVARRHPLGMARQAFGEAGVEQVGVARPAAMVHQPDDRLDPEFGEPAQPFVGEAPVAAVRVVRRHRLPQDRIAQRADAERGDAIEILDAVPVAGLGELVAIVVADADHGTFEPAPKLHGAGLAVRFLTLH